jgi:tetratricopeptide (TPR) repeat protein
MKQLLFILVFVLTALHSAVSSDAGQQFTQANQAYRAGDFANAAKIYQRILDKGLKSGALYYNLGNCYFKNGEFAKAILAYERAKKFMPDDEDLAYNLRLSYNNTVDKIEPVPQLFYQRWWSQLLNAMSPGNWAISAIILLWIAAGLAAWYLYAGTIRTRKYTFLGSGVLFAISLLIFFIAAGSYTQIHSEDTAIVTEPSAVIRSSPDEKSTSLFMLHSGTKIEIVDELGGWKQIRIANGNSGWIPGTMIEKI